MQVLAQSFDWRGPLEDTWGSVADIVPKIIAFLVILLIGRWIAKLIQKLVTKLLAAVKFDQVMDRAGLGGPLERSGFADSGRFIALIVYYGLMLLVLQLALSVFGPNAIQSALDGVVAFIPKLIVAIAILVITGLVVNAVNGIFAPAYENLDFGEILQKAVTIGLWMIGVFAALEQVEVAEDVVDTLFTAIVSSLSLILVIKFGVGGIWEARDRFWPAVYDRVAGPKQGPTNRP